MNRRFSIVLCVIALSIINTVSSHAAPIQSPYFWVAGDAAATSQLPLRNTTVDAVINGVIADVHVTQTYANTGSAPINARYVFPASTRAAVHGMQMTVGDQIVTARIEERHSAKKAFEQAKQNGQSASLLEQERPNVFTMQVANIMPGETVSIDLHYSEMLVPENGRYTFVYPTVVGPRYNAAPGEANQSGESLQWVANPTLDAHAPPTSRFDLRLSLATGIALQQVACDTHPIDVAWESEAAATVTLSPDDPYGGNRDFILHYRLAGDAIHAGLLLHEGAQENVFMLMVQPPRRVAPEAIVPREYIFVIDVSGSMDGFPLDTAKTLMRTLIADLTDQDRFNVILFAGASKQLSRLSLPAQPHHLASARALIDGQRGGGGTELKRALEKAMALPASDGFARTVVVVTDGYIAAEKDVFALIADHLDACNVFTFGIGSSVNRHLIEGLARIGQGEPFIVTDAAETPTVAARFKSYVQSPLLTDIEYDFGMFEAYDLEPIKTGDLFADRPLIVSGKWSGDPQGTISISGTSGHGPYEHRFTVSPLAVDSANRALPYLWARSRLSRISDLAPRTIDAQTREAITQLGLDYSMLTAYTAFVAIHEWRRNPDAPAKDVHQALPLPLGVSNLALGGRNVPEPGIGIVIAILCAAIALRWRQGHMAGTASGIRQHD